MGRTTRNYIERNTSLVKFWGLKKHTSRACYLKVENSIILSFVYSVGQKAFETGIKS
jgi:hypothetical protein